MTSNETDTFANESKTFASRPAETDIEAARSTPRPIFLPQDRQRSKLWPSRIESRTDLITSRPTETDIEASRSTRGPIFSPRDRPGPDVCSRHRATCFSRPRPVSVLGRGRRQSVGDGAALLGSQRGRSVASRRRRAGHGDDGQGVVRRAVSGAHEQCQRAPALLPDRAGLSSLVRPAIHPTQVQGAPQRRTVSKSEKSKRSIAVSDSPHRYGNSRATWDHTVLPATRQR